MWNLAALCLIISLATVLAESPDQRGILAAIAVIILPSGAQEVCMVKSLFLDWPPTGTIRFVLHLWEHLKPSCPRLVFWFHFFILYAW